MNSQNQDYFDRERARLRALLKTADPEDIADIQMDLYELNMDYRQAVAASREE